VSAAPHPKASPKARTKTQTVDAVLAALADPQRRKVVDVLRSGPRNAGDLSKLVGVSAPAMSRHLRLLKASGIVGETHPDYDARVRVYALKPGPLAELKSWLETTERLWAEQLASFKKHVER
jgi:DNA-binding transcriptional ArsR family regulator